MLLEVLSDFQISIPELGVIEARTHPIVVLTSNNSRELTEALKRRCLYLWLDYPEVEREMEIVRLHTPEIDEQLARRLVEVIHMVRQLDLKKPPSIAESIDWARALLLLGADDIDARPLRADDEHHRQAPHRHGPGGRAGRDEARRRQGPRRGSGGMSTPGRRAVRETGPGAGPERARLVSSPLPPGLAPRLVSFCEELRGEGVAIGTSEILDAFEALDDGALDARGGLPRGARGDRREVAGGPPGVRAALRPLLLPRRGVRGARARHRRGPPLRRRRAAST